MKAPHLQFRRELALVGGISLLALLPVFFLWRKSVVAPAQKTPGSRAGTLVPVLSRMKTGQNSWISSAATISPNGKLLARMEAAESALATPRGPNSLSLVANELVIRSTLDGKEVFRGTTAGRFVGWIPGTVSFVSQDGDSVNVFAPAVRKPGAPTPTQPWTQSPISFTPDPGGMSVSYGANGSESHLQAGAIVFSPDYRFAVKGSWGEGSIVWEVADLTTGKVAPPVKVGRWLRYDPHVGGVSNDISIAVAPASIATGKLPLVAVLQTTEQTSYSATPTPAPSATPFFTPRPTATYSPAQAQFAAKEKKEEAAIQALVESVLGVDGGEPQVGDEAEVARITAEVKRRNQALAAEKQQLFPQSVLPTPTPAPTSSPWDMTKPFQIETFDLNSKKRLWVSSVRSGIFGPRMKFAPDGSSLIASGTAVIRQIYGGNSADEAGIEFLGALTGKVLGKANLYEEDFGTPEQDRVAFYADPSATINGTPRSVVVFKDSYSEMHMTKGASPAYTYNRGIAFRLFNAANAHETGNLRLDVARFPQDQQNFQHFSVSQGGATWLVGDDDLFVLSRRDFGKEGIGPFPSPTPQPTPQVVSGR